jgi:hypothetical protein
VTSATGSGPSSTGRASAPRRPACGSARTPAGRPRASASWPRPGWTARRCRSSPATVRSPARTCSWPGHGTWVPSNRVMRTSSKEFTGLDPLTGEDALRADSAGAPMAALSVPRPPPAGPATPRQLERRQGRRPVPRQARRLASGRPAALGAPDRLSHPWPVLRPGLRVKGVAAHPRVRDDMK